MDSKSGRKTVTRRGLLKALAGAGAVITAAPMTNRGRYRIFAGSPVEYSARAIDLMKRATVIDMLSPLAINSQKQAKWFADPDSFTAADLQPYKDSGINIFHIAVGLGGPDAYLGALRFFASWNGFIAHHGEYLMRIAAAKKVEDERVKGTKPSLPLEQYAGAYADEMYGEATVTEAEGKLVFRYSPAFTGELEHWNYDTFRVKWANPTVPEGLVTFTLNAQGKVEEIKVPGMADFKRVPARPTTATVR